MSTDTDLHEDDDAVNSDSAIAGSVGDARARNDESRAEEAVTGEDFHGLAANGRLEQEAPTARRPSTRTLPHRVWEAYRSLVAKHQVSLHLGDDVITRILFWTPYSSHDVGSISRWREVTYGLLSLHRMAMDIALHESITESYGTTVRPTEPPVVPATALRIALTVVQNLMPTVLELSRSDPRRQAIARLWLERIKFVIRIVLLVSYWNQVRNEPFEVLPGLLHDGGMYMVGDSNVPSVADAQASKFRREYVGRRTGRRVVVVGTVEEQQGRVAWFRLILAEVLRTYRPLYWAQAEREEIESPNPKRLWMAWLLTVAMDVTSLKSATTASKDNVYSRAEWNRRRMKLLLYLLRFPAWERATEPGVLRIAALLRRVPLLGRLVETYIWEWLLYWKHPFFLEAD